MSSEFTMPIELRVGQQSAQVAEMTVTTDPTVWRPRLADALRAVADEIEQPPDEEEPHDQQ